MGSCHERDRRVSGSADVAEKAAAFTEAHPEIVQAALNVGLLTAGFGALATAVSKGIKLVADVKYLATLPVQIEAARMQDRAADKQLQAALLRAKELGVDVPGGKGAGGGLLAGAGIPIAAIVTARRYSFEVEPGSARRSGSIGSSRAERTSWDRDLADWQDSTSRRSNGRQPSSPRSLPA
jgi:hypothetical protein